MIIKYYILKQNLKKNRCIYMDNWISLLDIWNEDNIVNQLYSRYKIKS